MLSVYNFLHSILVNSIFQNYNKFLIFHIEFFINFSGLDLKKADE